MKSDYWLKGKKWQMAAVQIVRPDGGPWSQRLMSLGPPMWAGCLSACEASYDLSVDMVKVVVNTAKESLHRIRKMSPAPALGSRPMGRPLGKGMKQDTKILPQSCKKEKKAPCFDFW